VCCWWLLLRQQLQWLMPTVMTCSLLDLHVSNASIAAAAVTTGVDEEGLRHGV
jgi:hypothetical protein